MSVNEFLLLTKESNYDLIEIYKLAPNETLITLGILVSLAYIAIFFVRKSIKVSKTRNLIFKLQESKTYEEYNQDFLILINNLPKTNLNIAQVLNENKERILLRTSKLLINMLIDKKIDAYLEISDKYLLLYEASKKYDIGELSDFYKIKSKELLEINLFQEILFYSKNTYFSSNEVKHINKIVKYANSTSNSNLILNPLIEELNRFSYGYNLDLFKFIEKLDKKESNQIYSNCSKKIEEIFSDKHSEISIYILDYLFQKEENQKVYDYISSLENSLYLEFLYNVYFNKKDDLKLDLSFIANETKINSQYKRYLDNILTKNWKDINYIEFISKSPRVIEVLGHMEFRTLIERMDNIDSQNSNRKMAEEALMIAKRAESIALEAKSLNKRPILK